MDNNNPFLNIFNGCYSGSNSQTNLLANGLLPPFFNNIFSGHMPNFFGYSNLERMPTLVDNKPLEHMPTLVDNIFPRFSQFLKQQKPEIYTGFLGAIGRNLKSIINHQTSNFAGTHPQPPYTGFLGAIGRNLNSIDPNNIKIGIPIVRDPITNEIIAW